jgi:hypothetical protein
VNGAELSALEFCDALNLGHADCIVSVRVTNVDSESNGSKEPHKVLAGAHELEKKKKRLGACLVEQRWHFSPFVVSADGLLGKEVKILLKKLPVRLAKKWEKPRSFEDLSMPAQALPSSEPPTCLSADLTF